MIFSGKSFRKLQEREDYTFSLQANIDNVTGAALFGFSGTGVGGSSEELRFDFRSGRILDPEGKYIFSYKPSGDFIVSGNINRQDYNYYVNDLPIVSNGSKNDFVTKSFFLDCTGCKIETRNLVISASGSGNFYHDGFNRNVGIGNNQSFTGSLFHSGEGGAFDVFSGEIVDRYFSGKFRFQDFPTDIKAGGPNFKKRVDLIKDALFTFLTEGRALEKKDGVVPASQQ